MKEGKNANGRIRTQDLVKQELWYNVRYHLSQKLKLWGCGPTMYIILFNKKHDLGEWLLVWYTGEQQTSWASDIFKEGSPIVFPFKFEMWLSQGRLLTTDRFPIPSLTALCIYYVLSCLSFYIPLSLIYFLFHSKPLSLWPYIYWN